MLKTAPRPLTVHDYRDMPEGPPYYQLIEGELTMSPSPNSEHQAILMRIIAAMTRFLEKHPLGELFCAPFDVFLTDLDVYQPDLVFISRKNKDIIAEQGAEGAPDLVVEILSPRTAKLDRGVKRDIYARTGVHELWIVDPERKQVEVYDLAEDPNAPAATYSKGQQLKSRVLPKLTIAVTKIFDR